jgi:hypothetical protein
MTNETTRIILSVLNRAPQWIRHDLLSKDPMVRSRAEEALAAMIGEALKKADSQD